MNRIIFTILENGVYGGRPMTPEEEQEHDDMVASSTEIEPDDRIE
jgi:hypothetical protein